MTGLSARLLERAECHKERVEGFEYYGEAEAAMDREAAAEIDSLLEADKQRVKDISRLTVERDAARDEIDRLRARLEEAEDTLGQIESWANAYPIDVFTEPTDEWLESVTDQIGGDAMTRLHGSWGRHITEGVRKILAARTALKEGSGL